MSRHLLIEGIEGQPAQIIGSEAASRSATQR